MHSLWSGRSEGQISDLSPAAPEIAGLQCSETPFPGEPEIPLPAAGSRINPPIGRDRSTCARSRT